MSQCVDPIVGKILAGWRYDISGLAPEMGGDYEEHFAACEHCRSRQRLHRTIDISLIALASVSAGVFLLAFGVIRHFGPRNAFWLEIAALAGFRVVGVDLAGRGRGHACTHGGGGCGQDWRTPRARSAAGGDSRTPSGRIAFEDYRVVTMQTFSKTLVLLLLGCGDCGSSWRRKASA